MASLFVKKLEVNQEALEKEIENSLEDVSVSIEEFQKECNQASNDLNCLFEGADILEEVVTVNHLNAKSLAGENVSIESYPNAKLMLRPGDKELIEKHRYYTQYAFNQAFQKVKHIEAIHKNYGFSFSPSSESIFLSYTSSSESEDSKKVGGVTGLFKRILTTIGNTIKKLINGIKKHASIIFKFIIGYSKWLLKAIGVLKKKNNTELMKKASKMNIEEATEKLKKKVNKLATAYKGVNDNVHDEMKNIIDEAEIKHKDDDIAKAEAYQEAIKVASSAGAPIEEKEEEEPEETRYRTMERIKFLLEQLLPFIADDNKDLANEIENYYKDFRKEHIDDKSTKNIRAICREIKKVADRGFKNAYGVKESDLDETTLKLGSGTIESRSNDDYRKSITTESCVWIKVFNTKEESKDFNKGMKLINNFLSNILNNQDKLFEFKDNNEVFFSKTETFDMKETEELYKYFTEETHIAKVLNEGLDKNQITCFPKDIPDGYKAVALDYHSQFFAIKRNDSKVDGKIELEHTTTEFRANNGFIDPVIDEIRSKPLCTILDDLKNLADMISSLDVDEFYTFSSNINKIDKLIAKVHNTYHADYNEDILGKNYDLIKFYLRTMTVASLIGYKLTTRGNMYKGTYRALAEIYNSGIKAAQGALANPFKDLGEEILKILKEEK